MVMRTIEDIEDAYGGEIDELLVKAYFDFEVFFKYIIGGEVARHHKEMISAIEKNHRTLILISRGHGKSFLSAAYVVWYVWRNKGKEVLVVSSSMDQSTKYLQRIKDFIEDNEILRSLKPEELNTDSVEKEYRDYRWSATELWTTTRCKIFVRPFNSSIRGLHIDLLVADDILRDTDSSYQEDKIKYIWNHIIFPTTTTKRAKIVILGTPITATDLLADLKNSGAFSVLELPAVIYNESGEWKEPLWKEHFTLEDLKAIQQTIGYGAFAREYLLQPITAGDSYFPMEKVEKCIVKKVPEITRNITIGVDVALAQTARNDYTAIAVLGEDENGYVVVKDIIRGKWKQEEVINKILAVAKKYQASRIAIEKAPISYGLIQALQEQSSTPVMPLTTTRASKEHRLSQLQNLFVDEKIKIPDNPALLKELAAFKVVRKAGKYTLEGVGEHDDIVDAVSLAVEIMMSVKSVAPTIVF